MKINEQILNTISDKAIDFRIILDKIFILLTASENIGQANFVESLIKLIDEKKYFEFINCLNSVDMWGGAGAVWEVYIANKFDANEFECQMINLINLMELSLIMGNGIKPIRKIFIKNQG